MAFQDIVYIEEYKHYIDVAFRKSNKQAAKIRGSKIKGTRLDKSWRIELARLESIKANLESSLMRILKTFYNCLELNPNKRKELEKTINETTRNLSFREKPKPFDLESYNKYLEAQVQTQIEQFPRTTQSLVEDLLKKA